MKCARFWRPSAAMSTRTWRRCSMNQMASRLQPHSDSAVMSTADRDWRRLRLVAIALGGLNLVSYFLCDTREWLIYFDPFWIWSVIVPTFVLGLPFVIFLCKPANSQESTTAWFTV